MSLGKEARQRREAVGLICYALDAQAQKKADMRSHLGIAPEVSNTTPHPALAERLMARVPKWPTRRFAGQIMQNPAVVGLTMQALSYGMDDFASRPEDQRLITSALGRVLSYAAKHPEKINDADYELFQMLGRQYVNHPLVKTAAQ